jgi:REP-associated tyrosine transposase
LMTNHYHLLLETKEPNLSRGMGWLQNAFTRRINTRYRLWGHAVEKGSMSKRGQS